MNAKLFGLIVVLIICIGVGGFYVGQASKKGKNIETEIEPSDTPISIRKEKHTPYIASTSVPTAIPTTIPTAIPTIDDTAALIAMVKASEVARIGEEANENTYTVSRIQGDYAKGMASAGGGGAMWFAAKANGTWKLVFIGNGSIQCSDLTNYPDFPTVMIPECWDAVRQKNVVR